MVKRRFGVYDAINYLFLAVLTFVFLYPFVYVVSVSLSDSYAVARGLVSFYPRGFNFRAYQVIFHADEIWRGYANSIIYTVAGTGLTLIICSIAGYVLSAREFKFKKFVTVFFTITIFFSGGIIPAFLLIQKLGLMDSILAIVLPPALSAWYIILFRTNFKALPDSLMDAARMDGASHWRIYWQLVLPLSKPILATIGLFAAVSYWNSYFPALMYLTSQAKQPLSIVLRKFVVTGNFRGGLEVVVTSLAVYDTVGFESVLKMAIALVGLGPIVFLYPFLQRYFVKGMLVGAIKE